MFYLTIYFKNKGEKCMAGKFCQICNHPSGIYPLCKKHLEEKKNGYVVKDEITGQWIELQNHKLYEQNICAYCGEISGKYELCSDCYQLAQNNYIIKNDNNKWVINKLKDLEYRFYDKNKKYMLKTHYLNEFEMKYYTIIRKRLNYKYVIVPQVNLQTIIDTDSNKRNDELFRNVDFVIYYAKTFIPFLVIELNGKQHYNNEYTIERDKSIKNILNDVKLPLLTIDICDLKQLTNNQVFNITNKEIKLINPNWIIKLFHKQKDKMDLSEFKTLTKKYIEENSKNK